MSTPRANPLAETPEDTMTCHFIPPYLLRRLSADTDDQTVVACAGATLRLDAQLRSRRAAVDPAAPMLQVVQEVSSADRAIFTAHNSETLPGTLVREDHQPASGDESVDDAYDASAQVWDLFDEVYGRQSVDGNGTILTVTVHYGTNYDNAFWDGQQLVFGDGDGTVFDRFTKAPDVLAHEFTHGVTQFTTGLTYHGQSGALNESVSDVFAAATKQRVLGQTADQADWLIGEGLFLPGVNATALRSMTHPGTAYDDPQLGRDPQVSSMADYVDTEEDNGGVHLNSGIPNRAFALASIGCGGQTWDTTGKVWYDAITSGEITASTDFTGFAVATISSAVRLFGQGSLVTEQVSAAWVEVGVTRGVVGTPAPTPPKPTPPAPVAETVAVRRTGGFAGTVRSAELDLGTDPAGDELRTLLRGMDPASFGAPPAHPDRFVYTLRYGERHLTVGEQDLTPDLHRVVQIVLGD